MTTSQLLTDTWQWSPMLLISAAGLLLAYFWFVKSRNSRQKIFFISGVLLLVLTLASPLTFLGHRYLFSAHMAQHMILLLLIPPLLMLGIPAEIFTRFFKKNGKGNAFQPAPALCWLLGVAVMWLWHVPAIFNATMSDSGIPVCGLAAGPSAILLSGLQTLSLLGAGMLFSWPILSPVKSRRLPPLTGMAYLFTACIGCSLLGLSITFSSALLYTTYVSPIDLTGAIYLVRDTWGISPAADQQIGGLLMWVPGCFIYVSAAMYLLNRWFIEEDSHLILSERFSE